MLTYYVPDGDSGIGFSPEGVWKEMILDYTLCLLTNHQNVA